MPTPLDSHQQPDISYVRESSIAISKYLSRGTMVVLESTTYPGTTEEQKIEMLGAVSAVQAQIEEARKKEMEKKISLYEIKINELRELFLSDMSYEKLETLQFVFNTPKNKRSYNKTKKVVEQTEQILTTIEPTTEEVLIDNPYYEEPLTIKQEDITFDNEIDNKINKAIEEQTK